MNKPIALIGASGSMGSRYQAIMRYLEIPFICYDVDDWRDAWILEGDFHSILIATPTECHYENIKYLSKLKVPILCEKPITKNPDELLTILELDCEIKCVNQYKYLCDSQSTGDSYYNYFRTGRDGLEWDCISIIALADKPPHLMNNSPKWSCMINGKELSSQDMDKAYVDMIREWYRKPEGDKNYIARAHDKVFGGFYVTD